MVEREVRSKCFRLLCDMGIRQVGTEGHKMFGFLVQNYQVLTCTKVFEVVTVIIWQAYFEMFLQLLLFL